MKNYKITLCLTEKEIEIMRNCLSELQTTGVSLNLKVANALIDAGYHNYPKSTKSLDELLDDISVLAPGCWENDIGPKNWWAVTNDDGIISYFGNENDALRFRLDYINRLLNP